MITLHWTSLVFIASMMLSVGMVIGFDVLKQKHREQLVEWIMGLVQRKLFRKVRSKFVITVFPRNEQRPWESTMTVWGTRPEVADVLFDVVITQRKTISGFESPIWKFQVGNAPSGAPPNINNN